MSAYGRRRGDSLLLRHHVVGGLGVALVYQLQLTVRVQMSLLVDDHEALCDHSLRGSAERCRGSVGLRRTRAGEIVPCAERCI